MDKHQSHYVNSRRATAAKDTLQDRPHFNVMDNLNLSTDLPRETVQALYAVDTHINDREDHEACRVVLSRLLMADLGLVEEAERNAWAAVVKGGCTGDAPSH